MAILIENQANLDFQIDHLDFCTQNLGEGTRTPSPNMSNQSVPPVFFDPKIVVSVRYAGPCVMWSHFLTANLYSTLEWYMERLMVKNGHISYHKFLNHVLKEYT